MYCMSNTYPVLQTNDLNFHLFTLHSHETWYCTGRNLTATEIFQPDNYEVIHRGTKGKKKLPYYTTRQVTGQTTDMMTYCLVRTTTHQKW